MSVLWIVVSTLALQSLLTSTLIRCVVTHDRSRYRLVRAAMLAVWLIAGLFVSLTAYLY